MSLDLWNVMPLKCFISVEFTCPHSSRNKMSPLPEIFEKNHQSKYFWEGDKVVFPFYFHIFMSNQITVHLLSRTVSHPKENNWGGNIQNVLCPFFFSNVTNNRFCFSFAICIWININIQSNEVFIHMKMTKEKQNLLLVTFEKKNGQSTFWMLPPQFALTRTCFFPLQEGRCHLVEGESLFRYIFAPSPI